MPKGLCYSLPVMSEAPDSLFIWTLLQRASHTEQQQQHSSLIRAPLQLIEQDIHGQTQRVRSSESWGWILRSALRIGGYCWLKQLDPYKWTTRIIPRVESQISGMIWSSRGMRTENTQLKAISTLCTQDTEQAKDHSALELSFRRKKKIHCFHMWLIWLGRFSIANYASTKTRKLRGDESICDSQFISIGSYTRDISPRFFFI